MLSLGLFTGVAVLRVMKITRNYIRGTEDHANTVVILIYSVKDERSEVLLKIFKVLVAYKDCQT